MGHRTVSTSSRILRALTHPAVFKAGWMGLAGCALAAGVIFAFVAAGALAEQKSANAPKPAPAQTAPQPQPRYQVSNEQSVYLVRSTLATVHDANRSGNYSVLHNLATPDFQAKNTSADLAVAFLNLRRRNLDLFGLSLAPPEFTTAPAIDAQGMLRLAGFFPAPPQRLNFDLLYQVVNGQWRLQGIAIALPEAPGQEAPVQPLVKSEPMGLSSPAPIAPTADAGSKKQ